ncbi:hypothetical protein CDD80_6636 [Ophiocordyceps camponoti-rufipedis]|uniref:Phosphatidylinositol transfer protein SFH5 n=1 Tax=Ophiocordyceps camponoti-rufipedis TaxID=2004952 RepID=A0A2C5YPZ5_9HYPO|nr:hypothetical protein CDD80_6636 [Ophiocordyceps camponoti-rufipedis]
MPSTREILLAQFETMTINLTREAFHTEVWGIELVPGSPPTRLILLKFLRFNNWNVNKAAKHLAEVLRWRRRWQPLDLVRAAHDSSKFQGLGFVTTHRPLVAFGDADSAIGVGRDVPRPRDMVLVWNLYSSIRNSKALFSDVDEYLRYRIALMELAIQKFNLDEFDQQLEHDSRDDFHIIEVHDHGSGPLKKMRPRFCNASLSTLKKFSRAYPGLLLKHYSVNVPPMSGTSWNIIKSMMPWSPFSKVKAMTQGQSLAAELRTIAHSLPVSYGGRSVGIFAVASSPIMMDPPSPPAEEVSVAVPVKVAKERSNISDDDDQIAPVEIADTTGPSVLMKGEDTGDKSVPDAHGAAQHDDACVTADAGVTA